MSHFIHITDGCRLRKYSANTIGRKSVVKIEIDVNNHDELRWLLKECADIEADQKKKPAATVPGKTPLEEAIDGCAP